MIKNYSHDYIMSFTRTENIFFFINRAKRIQKIWRGYKIRKEIRFHMVCGACDNPEIIVNETERNACLADVSKIWNQRCKNCLASYDERTTKFVLCVQHLGVAPCYCCAELDFQRQILEAYDFNKKRNRKGW